jgi:hypothetical protein
MNNLTKKQRKLLDAVALLYSKGIIGTKKFKSLNSKITKL